ncbi:MAG: hypothetical protein M1818_000020 [Claussenomyces sp. TS43310]|nr:MAG: hypothetical protein M1818_000020 [Claussenomyces sp. TS43310]
MASELALCRIRLPACTWSGKESDHTAKQAHLVGGPSAEKSDTTTLEGQGHEPFREPPDSQYGTRLQWAKSISDLFLAASGSKDRSCIRDWDLVLNLDGSVENIAQNPPAFPVPAKLYPARFRLPAAISDRLSTDGERIQRAELFALGSILYEIFSGHQPFYEVPESVDAEEKIRALIGRGDFPDDIWGLSKAPRILGCWCPAFAKEMLTSRGKGSFQAAITNYINNHPVRFGFQVLGGLVSIASLFVVPILGAIGFAAAGPVAGSAAAAWQSSMGIVEAGSIFAWCQSAAMGGAALGGIAATGLSGAGIVVGATVAGALDDVDSNSSNFKEKFLVAWEMDMRGEVE